MKGWVKGMMIASAVCVGTGTAICASAWAMGGRFSHFSHRGIGIVEEEARAVKADDRMVEAPYQQPGGEETVESEPLGETAVTAAEQAPEKTTFNGAVIGELEIGVKGGRVEVITDEEAESIYVICDDETCEYYQEVDEDTLELEFWGRRKSDKFLWGNPEESDETIIRVIIPAGSHFREVDLEAQGGTITVDCLSADSLDLEVAAGTLNVQGGLVGELKGECMAGSLSFEGEVRLEADADCEAGSIRYLLKGREEDFTYEVEASVGSIIIGGTEHGKVRNETVVRNTGSTKYSELECSAGKIQIDFYQ